MTGKEAVQLGIKNPAGYSEVKSISNSFYEYLSRENYPDITPEAYKKFLLEQGVITNNLTAKEKSNGSDELSGDWPFSNFNEDKDIEYGTKSDCESNLSESNENQTTLSYSKGNMLKADTHHSLEWYSVLFPVKREVDERYYPYAERELPEESIIVPDIHNIPVVVRDEYEKYSMPIHEYNKDKDYYVYEVHEVREQVLEWPDYEDYEIAESNPPVVASLPTENGWSWSDDESVSEWGKEPKVSEWPKWPKAFDNSVEHQPYDFSFNESDEDDLSDDKGNQKTYDFSLALFNDSEEPEVPWVSDKLKEPEVPWVPMALGVSFRNEEMSEKLTLFRPLRTYNTPANKN